MNVRVTFDPQADAAYPPRANLAWSGGKNGSSRSPSLGWV